MEELEGAQERPANTDDWKEALERVVPCCLVLKVTQTRAFDTEPAGSSYASGFIVDKTRGIILTNRHVVTPGPIIAEAIFLNREELPVQPLYYDPVHDFAFLRFDPSKLQFMAVNEVPLAPEAAQVGLDIRVVGNDSGEKVSILAGTLARLDRDAPVYGRKGYNDFNTFYMQAASGTKGGSSGSPVIDCKGRAVGLNAGGKNKAASAYYLPLERVVRALKIIQGSKDPASPWTEWAAPRIPRGDLQTTFVFKGFDEVRRLGLQQDTEREVRSSCSVPGAEDGRLTTTGMLVVESVVPGSPADGVLEPGDVLVRLNGKVVTHFLTVENLLDDVVADTAASGGQVTLELERGGVQQLSKMRVTDLHTVTPSSFLELAGGSVHALSYQQARNNRAVVGQVYVAEAGYMLGRAAVPKYAIITVLNGKATPNLEVFAAVLRGLPHGARVPLEYFTFQERHRRKNAILHVDRQWYGPQILWTRDDGAGCWHPHLDYPPETPLPAVATGHFNRPGEPQQQGKDNNSTHANGAAAAAATASTGEDEPSVRNTSNEAMMLDKGADKGEEGQGPLRPHGQGAGAAPASAAGGAATHTMITGDDGGAVTTVTTAHCTAASGALLPPDGAAATVSEEEGQAETGTADSDTDETLKCCLVLLDVDIPLVALSDGVHSRSFAGNGLVVYHGARLGLVLVDRNTCVTGPCDVNLSFGAHPAEISGRVRFLHPLHNFALVSYDPTQLPPEARSKVRAATLLPTPPLKRGDQVRLVGLTKHLRLMQRSSTVTNSTAALTIPSAEVPRFRAVHEEVIKLDQDFGATFSGVLTDARGRVRALWGSYSEQVDKEEREWCAGLHAAVFQPWVEALSRLDHRTRLPPPTVRVLDAELEAVLLSKAAQFGLPGDWVSRLDKLDPERRQVLRVRSCVALSHAAQVLRSGDMVLAMAGRPVTCFQDMERLISSVANLSFASAFGSGGGCVSAVAQPQASGAAGANGAPAFANPGRAVGNGAVDMEMDELETGMGVGSTVTGPGVSHRPAKRVRTAQPGSTVTVITTNGHAMQGGAASPGGADADGEVEGPSLDPSRAAGAHQTAAAVTTAAGAPPPTAAPTEPLMPLTIFRAGQVMDVEVALSCEDGMGTGRMVHWCGAQLQAPHRAVKELGFLPAGGAGVYISRWHHGSPAHRYGLYALHWITELNGVPTPDLDTFLQVVTPLKDGDFVRVKVCHLETTQPKVLTLKVDLLYWPTWELRLDPGTCTWQRLAVSAPLALPAPRAVAAAVPATSAAGVGGATPAC